jgi:glycosyltransferase involved in cell wall biosynthesis
MVLRTIFHPRRDGERMNLEERITAICINYNTPELIQRAYESFRIFYPDVPMIIVDGSDDGLCKPYLDSLPDRNLEILHTPNDGHGPGLKLASEHAETDYLYYMDSDTEMIAGGMLEDILSLFGENEIYGFGRIEHIQGNGHLHGKYRYLHPSVCVIKKSQYKKFSPPINHGAPMIRAMLEIHALGIQHQLLRAYPVEDYVKHYQRGTVDQYPLLGKWDNPRGE